MTEQARARGLEAVIISDCLYDPVAEVAGKFFSTSAGAPVRLSMVLAGGEPEVKVPAQHGQRGQEPVIDVAGDEVHHARAGFYFPGSDGQDNGEAAGAIADSETAAKAAKLGLNVEAFLQGFDAQTFFEKTGDLIITGPTGSNVSDLMLLLDCGRK